MLRSIKDRYKEIRTRFIGGAIDVIVILKPDGTLEATPFYLKLGKPAKCGAPHLFVSLKINGKLMKGINMRVAHSGFCYFQVRSDLISKNRPNVNRSKTSIGFHTDGRHVSRLREERRSTDGSPYSFPVYNFELISPNVLCEDETRVYSKCRLETHSECFVRERKLTSKGILRRTLSEPKTSYSPVVQKVEFLVPNSELDASCSDTTMTDSDLIHTSDKERMDICFSQDRLKVLEKSKMHSSHPLPKRCKSHLTRSLSDSNIIRHQTSDVASLKKNTGMSRSVKTLDDLESNTCGSSSNSMISSGDISLPVLDVKKQVNRKNISDIQDGLNVEHVDLSDVQVGKNINVLDLINVSWQRLSRENVNTIFIPSNITKLVRLSMKNGKASFFTAEFLMKHSVRFDSYGGPVSSSNESFVVSQSGFFNLPSSILHRLKLRNGANHLEYLVHSSQGTVTIPATVFKWRYDDRLIVSDIDGTVTKSDVLGHIFGLMGMDYSHEGVAELYSNIVKNGYRIIYLSSRPILQMQLTRDYMTRIHQGKQWKVPPGPFLLNPISIFQTLRDELFDRKRVEDFKVNCMQRVRLLFSPTYQPFHAGFGNRHSDYKAYRKCGIPARRIFIIDTLGKVLTGQQHEEAKKSQEMSSKSDSEASTTNYNSLSELAHLVFPKTEGKLPYFDDYQDYLDWCMSLTPEFEFR